MRARASQNDEESVHPGIDAETGCRKKSGHFQAVEVAQSILTAPGAAALRGMETVSPWQRGRGMPGLRKLTDSAGTIYVRQPSVASKMKKAIDSNLAKSSAFLHSSTGPAIAARRSSGDVLARNHALSPFNHASGITWRENGKLGGLTLRPPESRRKFLALATYVCSSGGETVQSTRTFLPEGDQRRAVRRFSDPKEKKQFIAMTNSPGLDKAYSETAILGRDSLARRSRVMEWESGRPEPYRPGAS